MAGRKRKPTKQKELSGTLQPCRTNKKEPKLSIEKPLVPDWLPDYAQEFWHEISDLLIKMDVLTKADRTALALFANTYAEYRKADAFLQEHGFSYETTNTQGDKMHRAYPEQAIRSDSHRRLMSLMSEFGMTPASRSKVSSGSGAEEDPFEVYMKNAH